MAGFARSEQDVLTLLFDEFSSEANPPSADDDMGVEQVMARRGGTLVEATDGRFDFGGVTVSLAAEAASLRSATPTGGEARSGFGFGHAGYRADEAVGFRAGSDEFSAGGGIMCSCPLCGGLGSGGGGSSSPVAASSPGQSMLLPQAFLGTHFIFTGDRNVDAVLIGSKWTSLNLTFAFTTNPNSYGGASYDMGQATPGQFQPFNAAQQAAALEALAMVSGYTNLTFTNVTGSGDSTANIRFAQTTNPNVPSAMGYFPNDTAVAGDIWFNPNGGPFYQTPQKGNWGYVTQLHELGHTMGLKHGHDNYSNVDLSSLLPTDNPRFGSRSLDAVSDGQPWSLMTYTRMPGQSQSGNQGSGIDEPQSFMMYDIAALQYMYGANFNHNSSNTVYTWNPTTGEMFINGVGQGAPTANKIFMTLWDGGGNDTYDLSNYFSVYVDLRPGAWSTFSPSQLATPINGHPAPGNVANALLHNGDTRSLIENAIGGFGPSVLIGNQADNTLDSGGGSGNWMWGGAGNDTYIVRHSGDEVVELINEGYDIVRSTVNYALAANVHVEELRTASNGGTKAIRLTGNEFNQKIVGNAGDNRLDGGGGVNVLQGNAGNDTYVVRNSADQVVEKANQGYDIVRSTVNYTLAGGVHVEELRTDNNAGTTALRLTGNAFNQKIVGNAGDNRLDGGGGVNVLEGRGGNDTYFVRNSADQVIEKANEGYDIVRATVDYALAANVHVEELRTDGNAGTDAINLTGNSFNQKIVGNAGDNRLDGGGGVNVLEGRGGNDTYLVRNSADQVIEKANEGYDIVRATVSYALASGVHVEELRTNSNGGTAAINLTGNGFAQKIVGNAGDNVIDGGGGKNTLTGGAGMDTFVFSTAIGAAVADVITDFLAADDTIRLSSAIFTGLAAGQLAASRFKDIATGTVDSSDRILYNSSTGALFFDRDGSGGTYQPVQFAILENKAAISAADFFVV